MPAVPKNPQSGHLRPFHPNNRDINEWAIGRIDKDIQYQTHWRGVDWSHLRQLLDLMPGYVYYQRASVMYAVSVIGVLYPTSGRVSYDTIVRPREDWFTLTHGRSPYGPNDDEWGTLSFEEQIERVFLMHQGTPQHIIGWIMRPARAT